MGSHVRNNTGDRSDAIWNKAETKTKAGADNRANARANARSNTRTDARAQAKLLQEGQLQDGLEIFIFYAVALVLCAFGAVCCVKKAVSMYLALM